MLFNRSKVKQPLAIKFKHNEGLIHNSLEVEEDEAKEIAHQLEIAIVIKKKHSLTKTIEYVMRNVDFEMQSKHLIFMVVVLKDLINPHHDAHKLLHKEIRSLLRNS